MARPKPAAATDSVPANPAGARPGWVYLVGAGPGHDALITRRGATLLASADLVVHSEPLAQALRDEIHPVAQVRSLGRRGHKQADHRERHQAVGAELIAAARAGQRVVRLHGGDPLLFSRGVQLVQQLQRAGVPFEIVPGVCSPMAAAACAGLPLTHPELAGSVTFLSPAGVDVDAFDWTELCGLRGTLCVLMVAGRLEEICEGLLGPAQVPPDRPAALVQCASEPSQRTLVGTVGDLSAQAASDVWSGPTLLVVGPVVKLRAALAWRERQPLFGRRVLVPRPAHQAGPTAALLRSRGAEAVVMPTIAIEPSPDPEAVRRAVEGLGGYDLVLFTSENGVAALWQELDRQGLDVRAFHDAQVGVIGPTTESALRRRGLRPDLIPEEFVAEALVDEVVKRLGPQLQGARILLPRALVAREVLPESLRRLGALVDVVPVYQTVAASTERGAELAQELAQGRLDGVLLSSSSTVDQLCRLLGDRSTELLSGTTLASIGDITTATAERQGLQVAITASRSTMVDLIDSLERWWDHGGAEPSR